MWVFNSRTKNNGVQGVAGSNPVVRALKRFRHPACFVFGDAGALLPPDQQSRFGDCADGASVCCQTGQSYVHMQVRFLPSLLAELLSSRCRALAALEADERHGTTRPTAMPSRAQARHAAAATATLARRDGAIARPKTQCTGGAQTNGFPLEA
jgi:hypothetical protein